MRYFIYNFKYHVGIIIIFANHLINISNKDEKDNILNIFCFHWVD